ncbi:IS630 family transposase [Nannocystis sp. ILAH1]|uniref:IS630 family transposase n=1 Tax=Nannocystis sp. ILAH1 TaxID=2996789 RepID=UPI00226E4A3E|nr:IS630 family transposase [Nannocystis sp. ILAH1]
MRRYPREVGEDRGDDKRPPLLRGALRWRRRVHGRHESCDPERLIFLDESGSHISMTRTRAWAPCGKRAQGVVPRNRGRVTTMLGALSIDGIEAMMTVEGGTTAKVFLEFLDQHLAPKLRPGDIVVMDNLGAHHASGVRERIEARGAQVVYQPPYSPDLNPIELAWSKIKAALRGLGARTVPLLKAAICAVSGFVTPADAADGSSTAASARLKANETCCQDCLGECLMPSTNFSRCH